MAKLELILESDKVKAFKKEKTNYFEAEIKSKIEYSRSNDCYSNKTLSLVLLNERQQKNCDFGCQMKFVSSGFMCATDSNRLFLMNESLNGKYKKYFKFFNKECNKMNNSTIDMDIGNFLYCN